jgi:hypothetical protein
MFAALTQAQVQALTPEKYCLHMTTLLKTKLDLVPPRPPACHFNSLNRFNFLNQCRAQSGLLINHSAYAVDVMR